MKKSQMVLLIGLGSFGRLLAKELNSLGNEIMAIDKNEQRLDDIQDFVTTSKIGDSTNEDFLKGLGIENFDICYVTIASDFQSSLETTALLKELGAKKIIARAERDIQERLLVRNGVDGVIYPEKQTAKWAAMRYCSENISDFVELEGDIGIYEVHVPEEWVGKTIRELDIRKKFNVTIIALNDDGVKKYNLSPDDELSEHDALMVLGEYKNVSKCFKL